MFPLENLYKNVRRLFLAITCHKNKLKTDGKLFTFYFQHKKKNSLIQAIYLNQCQQMSKFSGGTHYDCA